MHNSRKICTALCAVTVILSLNPAGCGWAKSAVRSNPPQADRAKIAMLPFALGVEITHLSSIQSVNGDLNPEEESRLVAQAVRQIRDDARYLMYARLTGKDVYALISLEETDRVVGELGVTTAEALSLEQLNHLGMRLGADLLVIGVVQDYGKVRWQWLAGGMLADMTWESVALGLATAWNPAAILGNVGFELLTSTPVWFGGGYLFGVAFRPVRVEASAIDPVTGAMVWHETEVALYMRGRLKEVPEEDRKKKEVQLRLNLASAMEGLADSLLDAALTRTRLRERRLPDEQIVSF
jgi:uncharacterized membrane protein (DUF441 family)